MHLTVIYVSMWANWCIASLLGFFWPLQGAFSLPRPRVTTDAPRGRTTGQKARSFHCRWHVLILKQPSPPASKEEKKKRGKRKVPALSHSPVLPNSFSFVCFFFVAVLRFYRGRNTLLGACCFSPKWKLRGALQLCRTGGVGLTTPFTKPALKCDLFLQGVGGLF